MKEDGRKHFRFGTNRPPLFSSSLHLRRLVSHSCWFYPARGRPLPRSLLMDAVFSSKRVSFHGRGSFYFRSPSETGVVGMEDYLHPGFRIRERSSRWALYRVPWGRFIRRSLTPPVLREGRSRMRAPCFNIYFVLSGVVA